MSFEIDRQLCKLAQNMNVRTEHHGDDDQRGIDLKASVTLTNNELAMFSPTLKSSLYQREDSPQQEVEDDPTNLTVIKNPKMGSFKWDESYDNARVVIHHGASDIQDIVFSSCKVNKFFIEPKHGGTVIVHFRIQAHPTPDQFALLSTKLNQEVQVTIDPEGGVTEDEYVDTGAGANEIAEQFAAGRKRGGRSKRQMSLVE